MARSSRNERWYGNVNNQVATPQQKNGADIGWCKDLHKEDQLDHKLLKTTSLDDILDICREPPLVEDMEQVTDAKSKFMIAPFQYDSSFPHREPTASNGRVYVDRWDANHVRMPCSPSCIDKNRRPVWKNISDGLRRLRTKCESRTASVEDLKITIVSCSGCRYDTTSLEILLNQMYKHDDRAYFLSAVLFNLCNLALHVDTTCSQPPPLLRSGKNRSVTMSQKQAASLLACAFFCLFPQRSEHDHNKEYENFQNPNFNRLYQNGPPEKIEKLRCILHYFKRITQKMPCGVITIQRYMLTNDAYPKWVNSKAELSDMHITTEKKIEDISCVLQVDFANKYIGGGVLGNGCVQEEIRFSLCPEMLVSLLVCEKMEANECVFLIGCERYSTYEGYAASFRFAGDYKDETHRDGWGRRWCHLVAMDATYFRDPAIQYEMNDVTRELTKAYSAFRPRPTEIGAENLFGIASGNWGCGVFNGDKQLKGIIQWMAASEAQRPLIYAAYLDRNFANSFAEVYDFLKKQKATVYHLYRYLLEYSTRSTRERLFDYILRHPIS